MDDREAPTPPDLIHLMCDRLGIPFSNKPILDLRKEDIKTPCEAAYKLVTEICSAYHFIGQDPWASSNRPWFLWLYTFKEEPSPGEEDKGLDLKHCKNLWATLKKEIPKDLALRLALFQGFLEILIEKLPETPDVLDREAREHADYFKHPRFIWGKKGSPTTRNDTDKLLPSLRIKKKAGRPTNPVANAVILFVYEKLKGKYSSMAMYQIAKAMYSEVASNPDSFRSKLSRLNRNSR